MSYLPYLVAAWLFLVGLYGIVTSRNLVHAVTCRSPSRCWSPPCWSASGT